MKLRHTFFVLFVIGTILPYSQFIPWFLENGLNLSALFSELFSTRIGGFFGMDAIVSAVVIGVFATVETKRLRLRPAGGILSGVFAATILVGGSSGLPLFLYFRQKHLDQHKPGAKPSARQSPVEMMKR